jgi:hypothetical protein
LNWVAIVSDAAQLSRIEEYRNQAATPRPIMRQTRYPDGKALLALTGGFDKPLKPVEAENTAANAA